MTTDQFIQKQQAKIDAIVKENKPLLLAVTSTMFLRSKRIFVSGMNSNGSPIGAYVGGEIYVSGNARPAPKKPLKGKNGDTKFKNGKEHKSGYFANYVLYKKNVGRQEGVASVDLFLSGDLHLDWASTQRITEPPKVNKIDANTYVEYLSKKSLDKISKYPNVFTISAQERKDFYKVVQFELAKAMK